MRISPVRRARAGRPAYHRLFGSDAPGPGSAPSTVDALGDPPAVVRWVAQTRAARIRSLPQ
jgi:hypothetical protein